MIPLLTAGSNLPEVSGGSVGPTHVTDEAAAPGVRVPAPAAAGRDGSTSRPAEGTRFSAVLLALASIGTPFHELPATAGLSSGSPRPVPVLGPELVVGDEVAGLPEGVGGVEGDPGDPGGHATFAGGDDPIDAAPPFVVGDMVRLVPPEAALGIAAAGVAAVAVEEHPEVASDVIASDVIAPDVVSDVVSPELVSDTVTLDRGMLRRMSPEFITRLERVAERMWNEHGARVEVVEGYRSQGRQDGLFAQGRTAEGPVVTWTTRSLHTAGTAADVYMDGGPVSPQQAVLLARVAGEEGLRTLYPFDSGHIQLGGANDFAGPDGSLPRRGSAIPGQAVPSQTGVARVAPVARPARPARPGGMVMNDAGAVGSPDAAPARAVEEAPLPVEGASSSMERSQTEAVRAEGSQRSSVSSSSHSSAPPSAAASVVSAPAADAPTAVSQQRTAPVADAVPLPPPVDLSHLEATDGPAYRRLHLPIDGLAGASLDIGIRPGSVDAMLNISDPQLAGELRRSLHELRQVLSQRGIDARGLAVRLVAEAAPEPSSHHADAVVVRTSGEASTTGFSSHSKGGRQDSFEERFEERPERRDHPSHPRDDTQKEGKND